MNINLNFDLYSCIFFICVLWQAKQYEQYSKEIKKGGTLISGLASSMKHLIFIYGQPQVNKQMLELVINRN